MAKILVIGSLNMDLMIETPILPSLGETVLGSGFMTAPGGKGANQAVAAAKLGGDVAMVGCIGNDIFGKDLLHNLKTNQINTDWIKVIEGVPTGVAVIVINHGNNSIIVNSGANFEVTPELVAEAEPLIQKAKILVLQHEIPIPAVKKAIRIAKKHGVKVLLNPAPALNISDETFALLDIFTPNELELEMITGIPIKSIHHTKDIVAYLMKKGIPQVVITMGEQGVVYNSKNEIIHKLAWKVNVADTTGAGDSFSGALAVALSEGKDIDEAIDFGIIVGAMAVTKKGAQTSLPTRNEVEVFSKKHSIIKKMV